MNNQRSHFGQMATSRGLTQTTITILEEEDFDSVDAMRYMDLERDLPSLNLEVKQHQLVENWTRELNTTSDGGTSPEDIMCFNNLAAKLDLIEDVRRQLYSGGLRNLHEIKQNKLFEFRKLHTNVCVTGDHSVGKSSLTTQLLNTKKKQAPTQMSAAIEMTPYTSSEFPGVIFWDYPTRHLRSEKPTGYGSKVTPVSMFDAIIICACHRFTEMDFNLAKLAREHQIPLAYVRTKTDLDVANERRDRGSTFDEPRLMALIKKDATENLAAAGVTTAKIFTLSTLADCKNKWDFPQFVSFQKNLIRSKPSSNFLHQLRGVSMDFVENKNKVLSTRLPDFTRGIMAAQEKEGVLHQVMNDCSREYEVADNLPNRVETPVKFSSIQCFGWRQYWLVCVVVLVLVVYLMWTDKAEGYGHYWWYVALLIPIAVLVWKYKQMKDANQEAFLQNEAMCENILRDHMVALHNRALELVEIHMTGR